MTEIEIEIEAACSLTERKAKEILSRDKSWLDNKKEIVFSFNQYDLLTYLRKRPELCEQVLTFSYDKRYSPSTFIEEHANGYRVGWYDKNREQERYYDKFYEAATDFVLFSWNMGRLKREENKLPKEIRDKAIESGNEFGWRQLDFKDVIEAAMKIPLAIIGGQIQYLLEDGTCELYWLNYNTKEREPNESWSDYCNRTANECIEKFTHLISDKDIKAEALKNFNLLQEKQNQGIDIDDYKVFIIDFKDNESETHNNTSKH